MLSVVLPFWFDRPLEEAVDIAVNADRLGYPELWVGEMVSFDAFALAGALARETARVSLVVGPLPVSVRSPVALALGLSSVSVLGRRPAHLALGASTPTIVRDWHGRAWRGLPEAVATTVAEVRALLAGERSPGGFRLRGEPVKADLAVAAAGPRMLEVAVAVADRLVLNLVTPAQVAAVAHRCRQLGPARPPITVWVPAALDPGPLTWDEVGRQLRAYVGAPGYRDAFAAAGLTGDDTVALATAVGAFGPEESVRERIDAYHAAGASTVALVPATAEDPAGTRLLETLEAR